MKNLCPLTRAAGFPTRGNFPDLVVFDTDLLGTTLPALPPTAARLVVEVISPGSPGTDLVLKRYGYALLEVPEYWIVDDRTEEVLVLTDPSPSGYLTEEKHIRSLRGVTPFPVRAGPDRDLRLRLETIRAPRTPSGEP